MGGRSVPPPVRAPEAAPPPRRVGLGVSATLHLLGLLLLVWITSHETPKPRPQEEREVIPLDWAEITQPQWAPPPPVAEPVQRPAPAAPSEPAAAARSEPAPVVPPPPTRPSVVEQPEPLSDEPAEPMREPIAERAEAGEEPPVNLAEAEGDRGEGSAAPPETSSPRRFDLDKALREFRRESVGQASSTPPATGGRTGGSGLEPSGGGSFGMDNLSFESADFDWSDYRRQIYWAIWRAWHWRLLQTTNEFDRWAFSHRRWYLDHSAQIRFVIERGGDVTGVTIEHPSGCEPLDRSAVDALVEVNLPPLPAAFPREREVVHARFIALADIREMRRYLEARHRAGDFP